LRIYGKETKVMIQTKEKDTKLKLSITEFLSWSVSIYTSGPLTDE
jgi:hypothetical protein